MKRKILIALMLTIFSANSLFSQIGVNDELSIDSCIQIALANNYKLKVYEQNKAIAKKNYAIQKGRLFPTISFTSDYEFTDQFSDLDSYNSGSASIQLYQPIWQNGKIKTAIEQARVNAEVSKIEYTISENDIIYYTYINYINVLRNSKIKVQAEEMLKQFGITLEAAKERYKLGISKRSDVLKAETEFSNIKNLVIRLETAEKVARQNLLKNIAWPIDKGLYTRDFLTEMATDIETLSSDSLIQIANTYLPELKLINKQIMQQELFVLIEKKSQAPEIGAFTSYNWVDNPIYAKNFYGTAGLSLRLNIFKGFQKRSKIALEKIGLQQLSNEDNEIRQTVISEIVIAQMQVKEAIGTIANSQARIKSSGETLAMTAEEYREGLSSMLELIDAQYTDFEAQRDLINAQADYHLAIISLKRKTGILEIERRN